MEWLVFMTVALTIIGVAIGDEENMRHYKIQYQKCAMTNMVLAEHSVESGLDEKDFVNALLVAGFWLDPKTWLAPGCIQYVIVVA